MCTSYKVLTAVNCHVMIGTFRWCIEGVGVDVFPSYTLQYVGVVFIAFPIIDQPYWIVVVWAVKIYVFIIHFHWHDYAMQFHTYYKGYIMHITRISDY